MDDEATTCEDCGGDLDGDGGVCAECLDRRLDAWPKYQDWLRMTDKQREDAIRLGFDPRGGD